MNKEQHAEGDLHYGVSDPRWDGAEAMHREDGGVTSPAGVSASDPVTVDNLNEMSGLTGLFKTDSTDLMFGYYLVIGDLEARPAPVPGAPKPQRWLDFLKSNLNYLKLDKQVDQIRPANSTTAPPTKDKLNKNGRALAAGQTEAGKRQAIVDAHYAMSTEAAPDEYQNAVNTWVWDAFFRRTSKLGIKFTVTEGKVVHFNVDQPGNLARGGARIDSTVDVAAGAAIRGRQPITHSELRYLNRAGLIDSPNVDVYRRAADANAQRDPLEGDMFGYQIDRVVAGRPQPKPL